MRGGYLIKFLGFPCVCAVTVSGFWGRWEKQGAARRDLSSRRYQASA